MFAAEQDSTGPNCRFVIRPNRSLTWRGTLYFFWGIALVSFTIAGMFAMKGVWLILPFTGVEILALAACLYICARRGSECEIVHIEEDRIRIERGRHCPLETHEFIRAWARVDLQSQGAGWYPSRLTIRSMGRAVEVGAKLNEEERLLLAKELRQKLA